MTEKRINEYIEGKYGKIGVDRYDIASTFHKIVYLCLKCGSPPL